MSELLRDCDPQITLVYGTPHPEATGTPSCYVQDPAAGSLGTLLGTARPGHGWELENASWALTTDQSLAWDFVASANSQAKALGYWTPILGWPSQTTGH